MFLSSSLVVLLCCLSAQSRTAVLISFLSALQWSGTKKGFLMAVVDSEKYTWNVSGFSVRCPWRGSFLESDMEPVNTGTCWKSPVSVPMQLLPIFSVRDDLANKGYCLLSFWLLKSPFLFWVQWIWHLQYLRCLLGIVFGILDLSLIPTVSLFQCPLNCRIQSTQVGLE